MTSRPRLTLQTGDAPALPAGQPLSEELVATVRDVDVVLFLRQITTWVSPEIDYEREFQGGLGLFQLFWDILILISGLVSVSMQS